VGSGWEVKVLKQVNAVGTNRWEMVAASMGGVGIEGWICTRASVTKWFQYLCKLVFILSMGIG